jgi:tetratricopeptide (TPR) repeat protein
MDESAINSLFEEGFALYQAGESPEKLLPVFQSICDHAPKNAPAWTCLAWLYLLSDQPNKALKAAQKSVKINSTDPQARINLALAMLDAQQKGVRPHIEMVQKAIAFDNRFREEIETNIVDGLSRKPDWKSLQRVKTWLLEN